jgi:hypothetical protein
MTANGDALAENNLLIEPNAWAFLNIHHPMCAWNAYRGVLVSTPAEQGVLSVWAAALLRNYRDGKPGALLREMALERVRAAQFPKSISRLRGLYCFQDLASAEQALEWGNERNHFRPEFVARLYMGDHHVIGRSTVDANWITYADLAPDGSFADQSWISRYWAGVAQSGRMPAWETLLEGRLFILGTDLRERAYEMLRKQFPESLLVLETARLAAWALYDYGNVAGFLRKTALDEVSFDYMLDVRETNDEDFRRRVKALIDNADTSMKHDDILEQLRKGNFGKWPDLRPYGFRMQMQEIEPLLKSPT